MSDKSPSSVQNISDLPEYLKAAECAAILRVHVRTFYRGVASGRYPRALKPSPRTTRWKKSDILALLQYDEAVKHG